VVALIAMSHPPSLRAVPVTVAPSLAVFVRRKLVSVQVAEVAGLPSRSTAAGSIHCTVSPALISAGTVTGATSFRSL
jgi:hypothetical protein